MVFYLKIAKIVAYVAFVAVLLGVVGCAKRNHHDPVIRILSEQEAAAARQKFFAGV